MMIKTREYTLKGTAQSCTTTTSGIIGSNVFTAMGTSHGVVELYFEGDGLVRNVFNTASSFPLHSLELLPKENTLITGNAQGAISLFDIKSGINVRTFSRNNGSVLVLGALRRGIFFSGSIDGTLRIWDERQKEEAQILRNHSGAVLAASVSPDDQWLASSSEDGTLQLWNLTAAKVVSTFVGPDRKPLMSLAFNPEEIQISAGGAARKPLFFDLESFLEYGHSSFTPVAISCMSFDSTGDSLYVAGINFLRKISTKNPSEHADIEATWQAPEKIFFSAERDALVLARNVDGATLYKLQNAKTTNAQMLAHNSFADEMNEILAARKSHNKIMDILSKKNKDLNLLIETWLLQQNKRNAQSAIEMMSDPRVLTDVFNMLLGNNMVGHLSIEFTVLFIKKIHLILEIKYKFFIKVALLFITEVLNQFGTEIKNAKNMSLLNKVDLMREERIKHYDSLVANLRSIAQNHIFNKLRLQYRAEEIGQLAHLYVENLNGLLESINKKDG